MTESPSIAPVADRVAAIERLIQQASIATEDEIAELMHAAQERWVPENGARLVAKAWTDPSFKKELLQNGKASAEAIGLSLPAHHRHLVVLENTPEVHHVICCSLCSCTAFSIIGLPPDWYKDFEYRSRICRQARSVLAEMGLDLPPQIENRLS